MIQTKIASYRSTSRSPPKRNKDSADLVFLFSKAVEKGLRFGFDGMPGLDRDFTDSFRDHQSEAASLMESLTKLENTDSAVELLNA